MQTLDYSRRKFQKLEASSYGKPWQHKLHTSDRTSEPWRVVLRAISGKSSVVNFSKTKNRTRPMGTCNLVRLWNSYSCWILSNCTRKNVTISSNYYLCQEIQSRNQISLLSLIRFAQRDTHVPVALGNSLSFPSSVIEY